MPRQHMETDATAATPIAILIWPPILGARPDAGHARWELAASHACVLRVDDHGRRRPLSATGVLVAGNALSATESSAPRRAEEGNMR
jgi:hypothetical protein